MGRRCAVIAILFLTTPLILVSAALFHPETHVGVVLVDDCEVRYGVLAQDAFDHYGDYFDAQLLPVRVNASSVRVRNGSYLNSDIFIAGDAERLRREYDLDLVLFVTDHPIRNWDEDGYAVWGEADPKHGAALMTVAMAMTNTSGDDAFIQHTALHEVLHLYGYMHNQWDRSGIMQYATNRNRLDLSFYYEFQLPVRSIVYRWLIGSSFGTTAFVTNILFTAVLVPALVAAELALSRLYERRIAHRKQPRFILGVNFVVGATILTIFVGAFYQLAILAVFLIFPHHLESVYQKYVAQRTARS